MSPKPKTTVLFVCVHNAGRSQMAAGYLAQLAGERVLVLSAGTEPGLEINPVTLEVMLEEGIDLRSARPKKLTDQQVIESDYVITMGCGDACPYYPGKIYRDWPLRDPKGQSLAVVREIRNEIKGLVQNLLQEIEANA